MSVGSEWEAIEEAYSNRLEARSYFEAAQRAHGFAMAELKASEAALATALSRAERARHHAERAGRLVQDTIRLLELRGRT